MLPAVVLGERRGVPVCDGHDSLVDVITVDVTTDKRLLDCEASRNRKLLERLIREFLSIHDDLKEQAVQLVELKRAMSDKIYGEPWKS